MTVFLVWFLLKLPYLNSNNKLYIPLIVDEMFTLKKVVKALQVFNGLISTYMQAIYAEK